MQLITQFSKCLILVVLSCSLLIALRSNNLDITASNFASTDVSEMIESKVPNNIWNTISDQFQLDHKAQSAQVKAEIRGLLADQQKLYQILQAAAPYIYYIHQKAQEKGLPGELALIPVIESEFNPNDHSKKGATGLWQLMSGTANELGVKVKSGYDGRKNVVNSTNAALAYFKDLGNSFKGDWYLAIAAYNCGQVRITSAIKKSGSHNFWDLSLPRETKCYVPKLLAVAAIIENPAKYGVQLPPITNKPYFAQIKVIKPINLPKLATATGVSINRLRVLNPDYKSGNVPKAKDGTYALLVPVENEPLIRNQLEKTNTVVV